MRSAIRELGVFAFYTVIAIVLTWPLAANLRTAVSDLGDPLLNAWILDWDCYALTHHPLHLFDAPIFFPAKFPLAYSEHLTGIALLCLPFYALGFAPIALHSMAVLLGFALSAYGASVLARVITHRFMPSILAGLLYGFVPYRFGQLAHVQVISGGWLPLLLAALLVYRRSPTTRNAVLLGAAFLMNGLTNVYFFLFGSIAVVLTIALMAIADRHDARFWIRLAASLAISMALLLPFLLPYKLVSEKYGMKRSEGESIIYSATWSDWLIAPRESRAYGPLPAEGERHNERQLFPGLVMLLLGATALVRIPREIAGPARRPPPATRHLLWLDILIVILSILTYLGAVTDEIHIVRHGRLLLDFGRSYFPATLLVVCIVIRLAIRLPRAISEGNLRTAIANSRFSFELWAAALWIVAGMLGSFGVHAFLQPFLFHRVIGFRAIRVPARWAMVAYTGLAGWAAAGAATLPRRSWVAAALLAATLVDVWPRNRWEQAVVEPSPVDRWLAQTHAGPLLELPINRVEALYLYLLRATAHHVPIFDGASGFEPPLHYVLRTQPLSESTFTLLERNGCRFILVRPDWFGWQAPDAFKWLRYGIAQGRLVFLRRFDSGINGDWLFAMPRIEKQWQRFRAPQVPDAAGFTPDQELARLLDSKPTYSSATFAQLHQPKPMSEISGPLTVSGWAVSPRGIRAVNILINGGRVRITAQLSSREDVSRAFPWYPKTDRPAFAKVIPQRPGGVSEETDVQIEVIDGGGQRTLLPDIAITWR
jgi:hypothetical protein